MTEQALPAALSEIAPAKVNLTLRILGRRDDGYHELDSLVVFADVADRLDLAPGPVLGLAVGGPTAAASGDIADNLVIRVANALAERVPNLRAGQFTLAKHLPVAAGVGGGSADAAAALRLLARLNGLALADPRLHEAARVTGADIPVCIDPRARLMRGIGDLLSPPLELPDLPAVMINPGVAVPTKDVFQKLGLAKGERRGVSRELPPAALADRAALIAALKDLPNDLETPAIALQPMIGDVLAALGAEPGALLARMSGSGATCFGLFESDVAAQAAAARLAAAHPRWWVRATRFR